MLSIAIFAALAFCQPTKPDVLADFGPYDSAIPKPESVLGFAAGERHSNFREMEKVDIAIAEAAKAKVKVIQYGTSNEGRPLRIFAVSSPKNIARLDEIKADIAKLANPNAAGDYKDLIAKTPPIVWINECIHGDETASFESGMWLLYNLAASKSKSIIDALENSVVIVNPVFNPDGHERYVVWYNDFALGDPLPDSFEHNAPGIMRGRANHYRFDMNRDHITLSQVETRTETAEFRKWNPQVYVDQHGQVEAYFFPPNPMSINVNVDRSRLNKWTDILGRATAKAFDKNGWLYMVKNEFDFYAPNYTDTWATLQGAIGMTHETDHGASIQEYRNDGSIATLKGAIDKHFTSAIAVIAESAKRRSELLSDFLKYKRDAVSGKLAGKFQRVVVQGSIYQLQRFEEVLDRHGIKSQKVSANCTFDNAHDFWSDETKSISTSGPVLVIDMAQPAGPLAKSLLEPQSDFEPEFVKEQNRRRELTKKEVADFDAGSYEFYDITAWSLIYGFGLQAWWCENVPSIKAIDHWGIDFIENGPTHGRADQTGIAIPYTDQRYALATIDLLRLGLRIHVTARELEYGKEKLPAGSFVIFKERNEPKVYAQLANKLNDMHIYFKELPTAFPDNGRYGLGSGWWNALKEPKVGVFFGDAMSPTSFGHVWYVLERELKIPFTAMTSRSLNGDLHDYTCIIFPGRAQMANQKLRDWMQAGGCAVVLSDMSPLNGSNNLPKLEPNLVDGKEPASLPGSLFLGSLDARSFLAYGMTSMDGKSVRIAIPVDGSTYYKSTGKPDSVLTLPAKAEDVKLLSGWTWPEETSKALAGTTWAVVEDVGRGRAVFFAWDPCERAMYPGHWQLLLNAILFGPR